VILDIEDDRLLIIVIEAGHRRTIYRKYWYYQIEENNI
jgi:mRNA-degrading endonuclease RelE of RelBE toxin-antitoxin system